MQFSITWLVVVSFIATSLASRLVLHEKRDAAWTDEGARTRVEPGTILPMRIALIPNQVAQDNAEQWLLDVSDPDSPNYARHWTLEQVIEAFKPSATTLSNVTSWLHTNNIHEFTHSDNKQWFAFDIPAKKAEKMLHAKYYKHVNDHGESTVSCDYYNLPAHLQAHVDYITPGVKASRIGGLAPGGKVHKRTDATKTGHSHPSGSSKATFVPQPYNSTTSLKHCAEEVTPACIRALYNITAPDIHSPVSPNDTLGIFENTLNYYYQGDLDSFYETIAPNIPNGTSPIFVPIDGRRYPPTPQNYTKFGYLDSNEAELDIQIALPLIYPQNITVFEVEKPVNGFGYYDNFLAAIDGSDCSRTQRSKKLECGVVKPTNVVSVSYGLEESVWSSKSLNRQCTEFLKFGLQGASVFVGAGDYGVYGVYNYTYPCNSTTSDAGPRVFQTYFPASCPYVTAVGATEIQPGHTINDPEMSAEWKYYPPHGKPPQWADSTGGGFSLNFEAPSYQQGAVSQYFKNHNPPWAYFQNGDYHNSTGRYNRNGRGVPDLSALGTNVAVNWFFGYYPANGTSASTPLAAALFNRIVEERIRAGKGRIGFVNPVLYKNPGVFNDITIGANGLCAADQGFKAVPGWDPVTGLGTPNYPKLLDVFMKLQ